MCRNNRQLLVHQQFEAQATSTPNAIAVVDQGRQFTYQQLNARANQLARYLQAHNIGPERLVGLCLPRSPELIIALLAVLKAGGAYIPLDPTYPSERLAMMKDDAQVSLILTTRSCLAAWMEDSLTICLDSQWSDIAQSSPDNLSVSIRPHHLAYVIYTSGSTGRPKGVMVEHKALSAYVATVAKEYEIEKGDRILQFASICFDTSVEEIYPCLVNGATLVLRTNEMIGSAQAFLESSQAWGITVWNLPTAFWHFLATEFARLNLNPPDVLRLVIIGGEKALATRLDLWKQQAHNRLRVVNTYGPTEATVVTTLCDIAGPRAVEYQEDELPIGTALAHAQTYILDEQFNPVTPGTIGNLYIGGMGIARGYLNRPQLTAERFIHWPLSNGTSRSISTTKEPTPKEQGEMSHRLYHTGDRVRDRGDGQIEFLGRSDHQVKIRGFRVELFEIEAALNQHPGVQTGVVLAQEDALGNQELVAYVLPDSQTAEANLPHPGRAETLEVTLRKDLKASLPSYMVPAFFTILEQFPLTPSGKVDRNRLADLNHAQTMPPTRPSNHGQDTPHLSVDQEMTRIWQEVLKQPDIGLQDNFFELGGNSLLAAQLIGIAQDSFDIVLPIRCVYEEPTIKGLTRTIKTIQSSGGDPLAVLTDVGAESVPLPPMTRTNQPILADLATPNAIFLTGATGFLGAFLLCELLQQTDATVYCLVRAATHGEGLARLRATFAKYSLPVALLDRRVMPVPGYLDQPRLGLSVADFSFLANTVDIIYHSGAMVNFVKPYSVLAPTNVQGSCEILDLACQGRLKPLNYISTVGVFGASDYFTGRQTIYEDDPLALSQEFLCWDDGYAQTKWVAEQLMAKARTKGIPITVFRPGFIMGHSTTGAMNRQDFLSRSLLGCMQLGSYPDLANFTNQVVTVDYASRAIVHLSQQHSSIGQTFHLTPWSAKDDVAWNDLFSWVSDYSGALQKQPYQDWVEALTEHCRTSKTNPLHPLLPFFTEQIYRQDLTILELYENTSGFDCQNTIRGLQGSGITCPVIDIDMVYTYLSALSLTTHQRQYVPMNTFA